MLYLICQECVWCHLTLMTDYYNPSHTSQGTGRAALRCQCCRWFSLFKLLPWQQVKGIGVNSQWASSGWIHSRCSLTWQLRAVQGSDTSMIKYCRQIMHDYSQRRSHHFRSEGDKLFRGVMSDSLSSRIQLHLSLVAKEPHNHKQHSTRGPTWGLYNYILSKSIVKI